jgi:dihydrofolate synthase/folylpolyglutamate synthase
VELGLDRVRAVWERLGDQLDAVVVTVGGTNGKGSCVAMLDAILRAGGYRVGTYTSPHIERFSERIRIGGEEADDAELCAGFEAVEQARGDTPLTYFEHATLVAFHLFARRPLDCVVLEVGLGGRLDAVNIIDADVALVSTVDLDHMEWLGPDREHIGREKAGIFRGGRVAVFGGIDPPGSLVRHAASIGARLALADREFGATRREGGWDWRGVGSARHGLPMPALRGDFQVRNAAAVLAALEAVADRLPLSNAAVREGLLAARLQGRFEVFSGPVTVVLDVAHNAEAARSVAENLGRLREGGGGRTLAVFAMLRDKDIAGVARTVAPLVDRWFYAPAQAGRAADRDQLAAALEAAGAGPSAGHDDLESAFGAALAEARTGDRILGFGSFYTVAALRPLVGRLAAEAVRRPLL